ncbi:MAG TPA: aspartate dehydrogenase [Candidatus Acidoferrales bacterium]|jgi:aspartate dehydrogenase|nr:aspartate dehydrogenase [Candidatus Acidoferrales bacterium]
MSTAVKVGLLGAGAIGQVLAAALDAEQTRAELVAVADQDRLRAERLAAQLKSHPAVVEIDELVRRSDLIIEAASQAALPELVPPALRAQKDLMVMSVGGLLEHEEWFDEAQRQGCRIHVPSGAIAGLDGIRAAAMGRLNMVILTSRKPVAALRGAKYVTDRGMDVDRLKEETVLFEGPPEEACRAFPATSNVAASLRLAAGKSAEIRVRIVAVPGGTENVHEIQAVGDFGRFRIVLENVPSPSNLRTSRLAALSALALLEEIVRNQKVRV